MKRRQKAWRVKGPGLAKTRWRPVRSQETLGKRVKQIVRDGKGVIRVVEHPRASYK
jgi:hypothetical protein